jgi:hypothetical protein
MEKVVQTLEHYWKLREHCSKGKHKFRDNDFGMTWCVICGQHSTSPSNIPLQPEEQIITTDLK